MEPRPTEARKSNPSSNLGYVPPRLGIDVPFTMATLLARTGFRIRSQTRADCCFCTGHSHGTVAYTGELAFCHRCHWKSNRTQLEKSLGLLQDDAESQAMRRKALEQQRTVDLQIKNFGAWRDSKYRSLADKFLSLARAADRAHSFLGCEFQRREQAAEREISELAWAALGRLYDDEASLSAAMDALLCIPSSDYFQQTPKIDDLVKIWRAQHACE